MHAKCLLVLVALAGCGDSQVTFTQTPQRIDLGVAPIPAATPVPGKQATVALRLPRVGDVRMVRESGSISGAALVRTTRQPVTGNLDKARRFEVLAVAGDVVTRARVSFPVESTELRIGNIAAPWTPHLRDHSYLVDWRAGKLEVSRDDRLPLGADERDRLLDTVRPLVGAPDFVARAIGGKRLASDTVVQLPASEVAATLGDATVRDASLRLVDVRGDVAVFEYYLAARIVDDGTPHDVVARSLLHLSMATGDSVGESTTTSVHTKQGDREMSIVFATKVEFGDA